MMTLLLIVCGPFLVAAIAGVGIRFFPRRMLPRLDRRVTWLTAVAGGLPVLVLVLVLVSPYGLPISFLDLGPRAMLPLVLGVIAVALLAIPPASRRHAPTAQVSRRTVSVFLRPRWVVTTLLLTAVIVALTVAAGMASSTDAEGRYTIYTISIGTVGAEMGTVIYGWHYSVPALAGIALLVVLMTATWLLIPRPPWSDDPHHDAAVRRLRAANIGRVGAGALLIHLSVILRSLSGTASLFGTASSSDLGEVSAGTPFAALVPALQWSAMLALTAGLTLWIVTALTALPGTARHSLIPAGSSS